MVKGVETVSVPLVQYSLGQRRKENNIQASSAIALFMEDPPCAMESMQRRMETGSGRTLTGVEFSFLLVANCCPRQKSIVPTVLSLGSGVPKAANICPTERMYCSAFLLWMGLWLDARMPVRNW